MPYFLNDENTFKKLYKSYPVLPPDIRFKTINEIKKQKILFLNPNAGFQKLELHPSVEIAKNKLTKLKPLEDTLFPVETMFQKSKLSVNIPNININISQRVESEVPKRIVSNLPVFKTKLESVKRVVKTPKRIENTNFVVQRVQSEKRQKNQNSALFEEILEILSIPKEEENDIRRKLESNGWIRNDQIQKNILKHIDPKKLSVKKVGRNTNGYNLKQLQALSTFLGIKKGQGKPTLIKEIENKIKNYGLKLNE
jgi:hypothetical protein